MKILISGCSFTHWPAEPGSAKNICWPSHLEKHLSDIEITNLAEPGAGNQYIANSIIRNFCDYPDTYDLALVMWSGITRLDFLTDLTNPDWAPLYDSYGFYRRMEVCPNTLGYIFSGGQLGPWFAHAASKDVFRSMYKISNRLSLAHHNILEIIKCQDFLKARQIPYKFMSYVNYWNDKDDVSPNGDFGIFTLPDLFPLIKNIDFSNWIFFNKDRDCIYEMAKADEDYHGDRFHPGTTTHQRWAEIVAGAIKA